jgi:hypothetical protein
MMACLPLLFLASHHINNVYLLYGLALVLAYITARETQISGHYIVHSDKYTNLLLVHACSFGLASVLANYIAHPIIVLFSFILLEGIQFANIWLNKLAFDSREEFNDYIKWTKEPLDFSSNQEKKRHNKFLQEFNKDKAFVCAYMFIGVILVASSQMAIKYSEITYPLDFISTVIGYAILIGFSILLNKLSEKINPILAWLIVITINAIQLPMLSKDTYYTTGVIIANGTQLLMLVYLSKATYINLDISYNFYNAIIQLTNLIFVVSTMYFVKVDAINGDLVAGLSLLLALFSLLSYFLTKCINFPQKWDS